MPEATLSAVKVTVQTTGDGVDSTSRVNFDLVGPDNATVLANYSLANTSISDSEYFERSLNVFLNVPTSEIASSFFQIDIVQSRPNDHDHFQGTAQIYFTYSDGTQQGFPYGAFAIGTYHESSSDRRPVKVT